MDYTARQAPPSMGFSRQESWSGLPFPSPGNLPDPGIEPTSLVDSLPLVPPGKPEEPGEDDGKESPWVRSSLPQGHSLPFFALVEPRGHPASAPWRLNYVAKRLKVKAFSSQFHICWCELCRSVGLPAPAQKTPELQGQRMGLAGLILLSTVLGSAGDEPTFTKYRLLWK